MPISNVKLCPHPRHQHSIRTGRGKMVLLCSQCNQKIMLLVSSKRVMDEFYVRQLPAGEQYKIRREQAEATAWNNGEGW